MVVGVQPRRQVHRFRVGYATVRLWDTQPLRDRYSARRAAEVLRPDAESLVARLKDEKREAALVAPAVMSDPSLSDSQKTAGLRALLRAAMTLANAKPRDGEQAP